MSADLKGAVLRKLGDEPRWAGLRFRRELPLWLTEISAVPAYNPLLLADRFSIFHTTLQLEIVACEHSVDGCNFVDHRHKEPSSQPDQAAARQA